MPKKVSVGTTSTKLIGRSEGRSALLIANNHASAIIYVSDEGDATTNDFPVFPKTALLLSLTEGVDVRKKICCISDTASTSVHVWEHHVKAQDIKLGEEPDLQEPGTIDPNM
jgi:hypothetical protein